MRMQTDSLGIVDLLQQTSKQKLVESTWYLSFVSASLSYSHLINRPIEPAKKAVRSETLPASCNLIHMLCCQSPGDI